MKEGILSHEIYYPPETAVVLGSYAVQANFGDYSKETHKTGYLSSEWLIPKLVMSKRGGLHPGVARQALQYAQRVQCWNI